MVYTVDMNRLATFLPVNQTSLLNADRSSVEVKNIDKGNLHKKRVKLSQPSERDLKIFEKGKL